MAADLDDMRLALGSPTCPHAATTAQLQDCHVVIVAARARFTNTNDTDIRMGGVTANGRIIIELALTLRGFGGVVVMVTNPVDLMSRLFAEVSGIRQVVGIGSNLDSARYRLILAGMLDVPACLIRGSVIGEHGDTLVVCSIIHHSQWRSGARSHRSGSRRPACPTWTDQLWDWPQSERTGWRGAVHATPAAGVGQWSGGTVQPLPVWLVGSAGELYRWARTRSPSTT